METKPKKLIKLKKHPDLESLLKSLINKENKSIRVSIIIGFFTFFIFAISIFFIVWIKIKNFNILRDLSKQPDYENMSYNENITEDDEIKNIINLCQVIDFASFSLICHPIAAFLSISYMFLFWRRSCCINCLFRRPGTPMILHPFKKSNRIHTALVYGIIAFEVTTIVTNTINQTSASNVLAKLFNDPSGLFKLSVQLVEVFFAALRYYPVLVAFNADSVIIYISSAIYLMVDLGYNIFSEGK